MQVLPSVQEAMAALLPLREGAGRPRSKLYAMLDRGLLKLAKVSTDVLETHPWCPPPSSLCFPCHFHVRVRATPLSALQALHRGCPTFT